MKKNLVRGLAAGIAVLGLAGCSSMVTEADEVGTRYEGGVLFAQAPDFIECQARSQQNYGGPGDSTYIYPAGQRTFKFSKDPGSDAPPITVSAPSPGGGQPITMDVSGTVTFTPNFDNCDVLRKFHEEIGRKYQAWTPDGWNKLIGVYVKDPVDQAADIEALRSSWVGLTSNADEKGKWEQNVAKAVQGTPETPGLIEKLAGGKYFTINSVFLQRPELPPGVKAAIDDTESERQRAVTADQFAAAAARFPGGPAAYQEFQRQLAINKAIETGQVKIIPVPDGVTVNIPAG